MTRGQGQGQEHDARANIDCRDGIQCRYHREGGCRYRHNNNHTNQTNQNNQNNQTNQINQTNQTVNQTNTTDSFNMHEMKLTLDNLVKVVFNLKSLTDFPKVSLEKKSI